MVNVSIHFLIREWTPRFNRKPWIYLDSTTVDGGGPFDKVSKIIEKLIKSTNRCGPLKSFGLQLQRNIDKHGFLA